MNTGNHRNRKGEDQRRTSTGIDKGPSRFHIRAAILAPAALAKKHLPASLPPAKTHPGRSEDARRPMMARRGESASWAFHLKAGFPFRTILFREAGLFLFWGLS